MEEVKWIKIVVDIFDDEKILLIESLPDGDSIIVCWFKLLCLAGKQNNSGVFILNDRIPYTEEMFATIFRRPLQTVRLALKTFEEFGMIEIINGTVTIPNWGKHQNLDGIERIRAQTRARVKRYRESQKKLLGIDTCQYCGDKATGVDHIIAKARGGTDDPENLVPCCIRCNRIKNDKPLVDFLNWNLDIIDKETVLKNENLSRLVTFDNVTQRYIVTDGNETDKKEELEIELEEDKKKKKRFTPPTEDDVRAYCQEKSYQIDPGAFIDFYQSKNWMVGKDKMSDWKAAVRTWERRRKEKETGNGPDRVSDKPQTKKYNIVYDA